MSAFSLLITVSIATTACGKSRPNPWYAVLRQERLAQFVPPAGVLVLDANGAAGDTAFAKPSYVSVLRAFRYQTATGASRGRAVALRVAAATGWHVNPRRGSSTDPYVGWKRLSLGEATVRLGRYKKRNHYEVTIRLEQGACPVQFCGRH